ncbi:MAG: FimV family protein [Stenotrophomonas sp.]
MRSKQAVLAIIAALFSSAAMALGLGDIRVLSKPGQPLVAEIPVIYSDPAELENAHVALASPVTFERVGLARPQGLVSELQFQFTQDAKGRAVIRVTSTTAVQVPTVGFLIEVDWGQGRLVREYSALMNTPQTATAIAEPAIEAPAAVPGNTIVRAPETRVAEAPVAATPAAAAPRAAPVAARPQAPAATGEQVAVQRGQTLSQIAGELARDNGHSLNQTMVALLRANPEAFIRGNVHLLKQGAVLRTPRQDELAQIDVAQARAIVSEQTAQWRQARAPIPQPLTTDAVAKTEAATPAAANAGARLEIAPAVAAAQQTAGTTSGLEAGGEGDMLAKEQLQQAKEDLATRDAELQELRDRVADLEKLQKQQQSLIAMKDTDLAAAQQRLAQAPDAAQAGGTPAWLWAGLVLLALAGLAWGLSRRRKPSPLPPLARQGFNSSELASAMPSAAMTAAMVEMPTLDEREHDERIAHEDERVAEVDFQIPPPVREESVEDEPAPLSQAEAVDDGMEVFVTDATGQWRDLDPTAVVPLDPAPAGRDRLELAIAYMDLGDTETARTLLNEVAAGGDQQACAEAVELLGRLR